MTHRPATNTRLTPHRVALACLASLPCHLALAASYDEPAPLDESYYYGGASVGQSRSHLHTPGMSAQLLGNSATATTIDQDKQDTAYKVFGGYQFNRYVGVEMGFFDLGKYKFTAQTVPPGTLSGEVKIRGFNLDVVGTWPMTDAFSLLGRVGAQSAKTSETFSTTGAAVSSANQLHKHQVDVKAGVGIQYELTPFALLRAELEHFRVSDGLGQRNGVNALTVGLVFPFGRAETRPARVVVTPDAPPPMAKRDEPEPPIMAAAPPAKQRVSMSAESLFAFDQSRVQPAGQAALGKSEADPVTKPGDCNQRMKRAALITCLSPDRRVEIEVTGNR